MIYGDVCSGISAPTAAWKPLGWRAAYFAELEKFPSAVLAHHHPDVPNHGDMTRFREWPDAAIDLLVGGTPCQSFSVAGFRKGLDDPRGNLALVYLAVADRYRPRWVVWENVPGVLSSNGGRDLGAFLGGLGELGYGWAYRVLDAQWFGLAQRRRRVFVVGCLGDRRRAAAVLFEPEGLRGDPAPRREEGKGVAGALSSSAGRRGGVPGPDEAAQGHIILSHDPACTLTARERKGALPEADLSTVVAHTLRGEGFDASEDGSGRGTPIIPIAFDTTQITNPNNRSKAEPGAPCHGLSVRAHPPAIAFDCKAGGKTSFSIGDRAGTLRGEGHGGGHSSVAFDLRGRDGEAQLEGPHHTANIRAASGGSSRSYVAQPWAVRRLTPRECERLQGFPDDFTLIPWRGRAATDGPRYKALGNSMAVPVLAWIGRRIALADDVFDSLRSAA